jgi:hypothetical protein
MRAPSSNSSGAIKRVEPNMRPISLRNGGSVAKIGWGRKKPGPDSSSGGNLEEALHESNLSANVAFPDPFNLALPDHVRDLIAANGPPRRVEAEGTRSVAI